MKDYGYVYSKEYCEEIEYFTSDLDYSNTVMGCGLLSGRPYNLTFTDDNELESVDLIEE